jgi:hypothetical protein
MIGLTLSSLSAELRPIGDYLVDPLTETWRWNRIDPAKGTNGPILQIDPGGNLHIAGSGENLILYDGIASSQVPLPDYLKNPITGFHRTSRGHYLLTTLDSVNFFDGQFWRSVADSGLRQRSYKTIVETSDGIVWVGTERGLLRLNPGTGEADFTPLLSAVLSLSEGPNGASLWASMAPFGEIWEHLLTNGEIGESASAILRHPGLGEVVVSSDLLHASDGRIWYINSNYNLPPRFYDPKQETWQEIDLSEIGGNNWAFSVLETNDGAIWISSRGALQVLRNHKWKAYRSPEYPISGSHSLLIQDPEGYVYMADADGTIFRIDYARRRGRSFNNLHYQATTARGGEHRDLANDVLAGIGAVKTEAVGGDGRGEDEIDLRLHVAGDGAARHVDPAGPAVKLKLEILEDPSTGQVVQSQIQVGTGESDWARVADLERVWTGIRSAERMEIAHEAIDGKTRPEGAVLAAGGDVLELCQVHPGRKSFQRGDEQNPSQRNGERDQGNEGPVPACLNNPKAASVSTARRMSVIATRVNQWAGNGGC